MLLNLSGNDFRNLKIPKPAVSGFLILVLSLPFFFFLSGCSSLGTYNPATGRREFIMISTSSEVDMGKDVHKSISKEYEFSEDSRQLERVRRIGDRLARVSDRQDYKYHFFLIQKDEVNAFTTPGGNIYIYSGLLDKLTTDDQIASVLAHEMGHCAARHTVKKFQAALGYNIISAILISQIEEDQSKRITAMSANVLMSVVFSSYGRKDEYEADVLGVKYMHLACFDPQASVATLKILEKESKGPQGLLILRSHPYIQDRIKMTREEVGGLNEKYGPPSCFSGGILGIF